MSDEMIDSAAGNPAGDGGTTEQASTAVQAPSVIDLDENALIRVKGQEKPIKFSEYSRGFQSQFTKASQEAARLRQELAQEKAQREAFERQRQQATQQGQQNDVFEALRSLPYLKGEDAVGMVQAIGNEIKQRDMILLQALKKIQSMEKLVGGLHESSSTAAFDGKINRWLQEGGYDLGYADLAKEIYLAYEGDDLDTEFPQIFANRVAQIEKLIEAKRAQALSRAKGSPFVPGKGGQGKPSAPLQLDPKADARATADAIWDSLHPGSGT